MERKRPAKKKNGSAEAESGRICVSSAEDSEVDRYDKWALLAPWLRACEPEINDFILFNLLFDMNDYFVRAQRDNGR